MPICARAIEQSDGSYLLGLDPTVAEPTTCPYVVVTGAESKVGSLLNLSIEDGSMISMAIIGVWAIAWGFRTLADQISSRDELHE